jgi:hypothetical protein
MVEKARPVASVSPRSLVILNPGNGTGTQLERNRDAAGGTEQGRSWNGTETQLGERNRDAGGTEQGRS